MRTTISVDDDVYYAIKERARREHRSAGSVLSDLARQALIGHPVVSEVISGGDSYGFDPFPHRGTTVSNAIIDRLRAEDTE